MLLDTHVVLWILQGGDRLGSGARNLLTSSSRLLVSAVSLWEISIKSSQGKLSVPPDLPARIEAAGLSWLPMNPEHAWMWRGVDGLPHRDPFDRMLLAQAASERVSFLTADRVILAAAADLNVACIDARA